MSKEKINEKKLAGAAGGADLKEDENVMLCESCGYREIWTDDYMKQLQYQMYYECPSCHKKTFMCITCKSLKMPKFD